MKFSLLLAKYLKSQGINTIHTVTGGAVVHIIDSCVEASIKAIFYQHEQSAAFAAVAEAKSTGKPSCCIVTTGPGGTNALTGLLSAWQDSQPVLFISGQARLEHTSLDSGVRQIGTQEFCITNLVNPIVKKEILMRQPNDLIQNLESLLIASQSDRPGPVWLDVPLNFQWQMIKDVSNSFTQSSRTILDSIKNEYLKYQFKNTYFQDYLLSKRPCFILGGGIKNIFKKKLIYHLEKNSIPYVMTYNSLSGSYVKNSKYNFGVLGIAGNRRANSVIHNSDFVICIGTHLPVPLTGANHLNWCANSKKVLVNIDQKEIDKNRITFDYKYCIESSLFIEDFLSRDIPKTDLIWKGWLTKVQEFTEPRKISKKQYIDLYDFLEKLNLAIKDPTNIVIDGGGTINAAAFSHFKPDSSCNLIMSSGVCSMGSGIPELVGSSLALSESTKNNILLIGDGSLAFNIQELSTIKFHNIPSTIFVICNNGYSSIRNTLSTFLEGRLNGVSPETGVWMPSVYDYSNSYKFNYFKLKTHSNNLRDDISEILSKSGQNIVEVLIDPNQEMAPSQGFRDSGGGKFVAAPLYAMNPILSKDQENLMSRFIPNKNLKK